MMCEGCPFNDTEEANQAQNWGCLPTPSEMVKRLELTGEALSCNDNQAIACIGLSMVRDTIRTKVLPYSKWFQGEANELPAGTN